MNRDYGDYKPLVPDKSPICLRREWIKGAMFAEDYIFRTSPFEPYILTRA